MKKILNLFLFCCIFCLAASVLITCMIRSDTSSADSFLEKRAFSQQNTPETAEELLLEGTVVILDPGHGGNDPGMVLEDIYEKDINLKISKNLQKLLESHGCDVLFTREDDTYVSLEERVQMTSRISPKKHTQALFVSIHLNALDNDNITGGVETYFNSTASPENKQLAESIQNGIIEQTGAKDRGTRDGSGFYVVRKPDIPSCLVEAGFLTSDTERPLLLSDDYQQKIAAGIANGILRYLSPDR